MQKVPMIKKRLRCYKQFGSKYRYTIRWICCEFFIRNIGERASELITSQIENQGRSNMKRYLSVAGIITILTFIFCTATRLMASGGDSNLLKGSALSDYDPSTTEEFRMRLALPNFFSKVNLKDTIRVGYVGGSITAGEGKWSELTFNWLKNRYPQSHFEMINIAVPGTPVPFGTFRIGPEMLERKLDLVFIEYRVNGLGNQGISGPEGMVRQIYRANPNTDICMVYTISQGMIDKIRNGEQTSVGQVMETVANYYGIPSIDMGIEVVKLLDEGKLIFKSSDPVEGKIVFSKDGTHPIEEGIQIYTDVVTRNLMKMEDNAASLSHQLPEPIDAKNFEYPTIHTVDEVTKSTNWILNDNDTDPIFRSDRWRSAYVLNKIIKCGVVGETLTFDWEGFALCITTIPQGNQMEIEVSTDGGTPKAFTLEQTSATDFGPVMLYPPQVANGKHTTTVKIKALPNSESFYFGQFYSLASNAIATSSEVLKRSELKIYPTVVEDFIMAEGIGESAKYGVYSMKGTLIQTGETDANTINVQHLHSGFYIIDVGFRKAKFIKR